LNHCVQRNSSVQPLGDTETLHLENGEFRKHQQSCFDSLDFRINFQPSLMKLLSREHEPRFNGISCRIDTSVPAARLAASRLCKPRLRLAKFK
jgi:hypothetical protein